MWHKTWGENYKLANQFCSALDPYIASRAFKCHRVYFSTHMRRNNEWLGRMRGSVDYAHTCKLTKLILHIFFKDASCRWVWTSPSLLDAAAVFNQPELWQWQFSTQWTLNWICYLSSSIHRKRRGAQFSSIFSPLPFRLFVLVNLIACLGTYWLDWLDWFSLSCLELEVSRRRT